jgi:hypothetical protein
MLATVNTPARRVNGEIVLTAELLIDMDLMPQKSEWLERFSVLPRLRGPPG